MIKKYFLIFVSLVFIIFLSLWQLAGINSGIGWWSRLDLAILALSFILMFWGLRQAWWWALGFGLIFDLFSFSFFGSHLLAYLGAILIGAWLLKQVLTNRSLYSFLTLVAVTVVSSKFIFYFLLSGESFFRGGSGFFIFQTLFWYYLLQQLVLSIVLATGLFYLFSARNRRRSGFLSQH